ncbi:MULTISPECIES: hypothetical protein [Streptomyces]|uniref:Uncharacterized protein n=1 Tax=Streptomyces siderophoricus TaxID=2802281 RepID=A0ABS1MQ58_9ACTN|nr:hypothetical protein [Streptomyces sp. 9-7]MBL1089910.1 hypothetical protein [Streptomyces sp. 9-7]
MGFLLWLNEGFVTEGFMTENFVTEDFGTENFVTENFVGRLWGTSGKWICDGSGL